MSAIHPVVDYAKAGAVAVMTIGSPPVNALSAAVRAGLDAGLRQALADRDVGAIVLICEGRTFIAGADITEFGKPPQRPMLGELLDAMDASSKPIVAAMHGTALGGGFELALAAHYRIATPDSMMGLPEIRLGLIPGGGGTQRLPRLIGFAPALDVILSGAPFTAAQALAWGAVDRLATEGSLREDAIALAGELAQKGAAPPRVRDREDRVVEARATPQIFDAARKAFARKYRGFDAWIAALQSIENAARLPFDEGIAAERALFATLVAGSQSKAQRHVFFAEREAAKIPDLARETPTLPIARVGVIGAGTMGGGIAMNFLAAGLPVTIVEMQTAALDRGLSVIRRNYESTRAKGRMSAAEVEARMSLLCGTTEFDALADCDLIIEAVYEEMDVKQAIFRQLDRVARPDAILASNTSYLDIDAIAACTDRPERVLGLHFFSPANVMRLLEIVRGAKTSAPVIATAMKIARQIGKVGVLVDVCHGFVGNRMLAQRQREANRLILEGASPLDVDRVLYDFGMPMGPFAMADLAGLDLGWTREKSTGTTVREVLCEMDRRGQKNGRGFYDYDENRSATPSADVERVILDVSSRLGIMRRPITDEEILERTLYPMINEGAKILEEGKALRASDIDVVWINGYGWPAYRGGPMFHADTIGLGRVLDGLLTFETRLGAEFKPSPLLERLVAEGRGFGSGR